MQSCPLCKTPTTKIKGIGELNHAYEIICSICGEYQISDTAVQQLESYSNNENRPKIAALTKRRSLLNKKILIIVEKTNNFEYEIPQVTINEAISQFPVSVSERLNQALVNLALDSKVPGTLTRVNYSTSPLLMCSSFNNKDELIFMLDSLYEKSLITLEKDPNYIKVKVTAKGWDHVDAFNRGDFKESKQGFIAMSFDPNMDVASGKIQEAIKNAGFEPMRIDNKQHNERIDAEIIAEIKRSKFVVVDVTQHRNGVYYEAGFAQGLGIPVIWTCHEKDFTQLHFDTRQINHIRWNMPEELYTELYNRIRATIV